MYSAFASVRKPLRRPSANVHSHARSRCACASNGSGSSGIGATFNSGASTISMRSRGRSALRRCISVQRAPGPFGNPCVGSDASSTSSVSVRALLEGATTIVSCSRSNAPAIVPSTRSKAPVRVWYRSPTGCAIDGSKPRSSQTPSRRADSARRSACRLGGGVHSLRDGRCEDRCCGGLRRRLRRLSLLLFFGLLVLSSLRLRCARSRLRVARAVVT